MSHTLLPIAYFSFVGGVISVAASFTPLAGADAFSIGTGLLLACILSFVGELAYRREMANQGSDNPQKKLEDFRDDI